MKNIIESNEVALTTFDNPYNPFDDFTSWFLFDTEKGYNSCSRLARFTHITDDMSEVEVNLEIERAIDTIISYDFTNNYKKIKRNKTRTE